MNPFDWLAIAILAVLVILAIRYARKHKCSGDCASCQTACSRKPGEVPDFVKRYRKDHPKPNQPE